MKILPQRKPNRLQGYDYSQAGRYFVTICTIDRECIFGRVNASGKMERSPLGELALQELLQIPNHRPYVKIHSCVVMPNHVHVMLELCRDTTCRVRRDSSGSRDGDAGSNRAFGQMQKDSLMTVIHAYKAAVTRNWRKAASEDPAAVMVDAGAKTAGPGAGTAYTGAKTADIGAGTADTGARTVDAGAKTADTGAGTADTTSRVPTFGGTKAPVAVTTDPRTKTMGSVTAAADVGAKMAYMGAGTADTDAKTADIGAGTADTTSRVPTFGGTTAPVSVKWTGCNPQTITVIWQKGYHDHIVRNEEEFLRICQYIASNPEKWREDRFYNEPGGIDPFQ